MGLPVTLHCNITSVSSHGKCINTIKFHLTILKTRGKLEKCTSNICIYFKNYICTNYTRRIIILRKRSNTREDIRLNTRRRVCNLLTKFLNDKITHKCIIQRPQGHPIIIIQWGFTAIKGHCRCGVSILIMSVLFVWWWLFRYLLLFYLIIFFVSLYVTMTSYIKPYIIIYCIFCFR